MSPAKLPNFSGGVLAGGEGRRFGGLDKGWLEHAGRPFIEITLDHLRPLASELRISANRHLDRYAALGLPVLSDRLGAGPLAGLLRLLETATTDWLLSLPCDALALPESLPERLFARQRATQADIVVLEDDDGVHPTVSLTRCALAPDLERFLLGSGRQSVKDWQARHRTVRLRSDGVLANVNDPLALDRYAQSLACGSPAHG